MPFTPSHALVALPFIRTPLVPAAIAIGAMTPDLPLFLRGIGLGYGFTHTAANVVWTALVAFALLLLWRSVLRPAVPELAPKWLTRRLPEDWSDGATASFRRALGMEQPRLYPLWLAISLVLGVLSHIAWDLFTHEGRGGVQLLPMLDEQWGPMAGYKWLQHGSSVVGLAIIGLWVLLWVRRSPVREVSQFVPNGVRIAWWLSLPVFLIGAWILGVIAFGPFTHDFTVAHLAYGVLPLACGCWGVLTLLLCIAIAAFRPAHQRG